MTNENRYPIFSSTELLSDPILGDDISADGDGILDDEILTKVSHSSIFAAASDDAVAISRSSRTTIASENSGNNHQPHATEDTYATDVAASALYSPDLAAAGRKRSGSEESGSQSWGEWDVPLGRAQEVREHIGNTRFRGIVEQHRPAYLQAKRKSEKTTISVHVHSIVTSNGGRFLDKNKARGEWLEITHEKALAKISQALRNGTRPVRKLSIVTIAPQHSPQSPATAVAQPYQIPPSSFLPIAQEIPEMPATRGSTALATDRKQQDESPGVDLSGMYISVPYEPSNVLGNLGSQRESESSLGLNDEFLSFISTL